MPYPDSFDATVGFGCTGSSASSAGTCAGEIDGSGNATFPSVNLPSTTSPLEFAGAAGTSGQCAISGGAGVTPSWGSCGGGSPAFSSITSGSNTTATMTVGTGGSLAYTGGGILNASELLGSTWASPAAIGSTTPAAGTFTEVTVTSASQPSEATMTYVSGHAPSGASGSAVIAPDSSGNLDVSENGGMLSRICDATNTICVPYPVDNAITSATGGSGTSTVTCLTAACTNISGSYSVVGGTFTTGTFLTLVWPTTTTAYRCWVTQNGGVAAYGLGHGVATATGMTVTSGISIAGVTVSFDYGCNAL